jgi:hypothetical protein
MHPRLPAERLKRFCSDPCPGTPFALFRSPLTGGFERLSNLPKMFGPGIPGSFGLAICLAVCSVRDDLRIIGNGKCLSGDNLIQLNRL